MMGEERGSHETDRPGFDRPERRDARRRISVCRCVFALAILLTAAAFRPDAPTALAQEAGDALEEGAREVALTIYNSDLALVKDVRKRDLTKGETEVLFRDVAARIDPTSVHLRSHGSAGDLRVLEQNYQFDLASSEAILKRYLERGLEVVDENGDLYRGVLLNYDPSHLVMTSGDGSGSVNIFRREDLTRINLPRLPESLVIRPTLAWLVTAGRGGEQDLELEYLTSGINWHAEYVAVVAPDTEKLLLSAWVSVDNRSGATYRDARVKLVAGDVHRVKDRPLTPERVDYRMSTAAGPLVEERSFFEYHLYSLSRPTTVRDKEIKQVTLLETTETRAKRIYEYDGARYADDVRVVLQLRNSADQGLGMPLPQGKVRVYQEDVDGSLEFVGEDRIDHTPRDEEIDLYVGNAFDISAERSVVDARRISQHVSEETVEVKLRNHREDDVNVKVVEHLRRNWEVLETTHEYRKKDAATIEFSIPAPKDEEVVLRYRVRYEQ